MYQEERIYQILQLLKDKKTLSNKEIMDYLQVSRDTARRDIIRLVEEGGAIRTHGGIAFPAISDEIQEYRVRSNMNSQEKEAIARSSLSYVAEDQLYFFDVSTTVFQLCRMISKPISCYTNSLDNLMVLMEKGLDVHLLGGKVNPKNRFLYGNEALSIIEKLYFDVSFLGAAAIHEDGFYVADQEDAIIKRNVAKRSGAVYVLADHQKILKRSRYQAMAFSEVNYLITNEAVPDQIRDRMQAAGTEIIIVQ